MGRRHRKHKRSPEPQDVLAGRVELKPAELVELIHRVNPTGRELDAKEEVQRYRQKAGLQSLLIRRHGDERLLVTPAEDEGVVSLSYGARDACHAVVDELETDARAWVRRRLDLAALESDAGAAVRHVAGIEDHPRLAEVEAVLAVAALGRGDAEAAVRYRDAVAARDPEHPRLATLDRDLAELRERGRQAAEEDLGRRYRAAGARAVEPAARQLLAEWGESALARRILRELGAAHHQEQVAAHLERGENALAGERFDEAARHFEAFLPEENQKRSVFLARLDRPADGKRMTCSSALPLPADPDGAHAMASDLAAGLAFVLLVTPEDERELWAFDVSQPDLQALYNVKVPFESWLVQDRRARHVAVLSNHGGSLVLRPLGSEPPSWEDVAKNPLRPERGFPNALPPFPCGTPPNDGIEHFLERRRLQNLPDPYLESFVRELPTDRKRPLADSIALLHWLLWGDRCQEVVEESIHELSVRHPEHAGVKLLRARLDVEAGRWAEARRLLEEIRPQDLEAGRRCHVRHLLGLSWQAACPGVLSSRVGQGRRLLATRAVVAGREVGGGAVGGPRPPLGSVARRSRVT